MTRASLALTAHGTFSLSIGRPVRERQWFSRLQYVVTSTRLPTDTIRYHAIGDERSGSSLITIDLRYSRHYHTSAGQHRSRL